MGKVGEAQKTTREAQESFAFCINIGKLDVSKDVFSDYICEKLL